MQGSWPRIAGSRSQLDSEHPASARQKHVEPISVQQAEGTAIECRHGLKDYEQDCQSVEPSLLKSKVPFRKASHGEIEKLRVDECIILVLRRAQVMAECTAAMRANWGG